MKTYFPTKIDRVVKIIAVLCFGLTIAAIIVARNSPATGYESSIYEATPVIVWGALILSLVCGIGIIIHQVYTRNEASRLWVLGLALIMLSNAVILSLWLIRGYAFWSLTGDPGYHFSVIRDVIATSHVTQQNFYPVTHIYVAQISQILGVNPVVLVNLTPFFFSLLGVPFMYFLAKSLLPHRGQVILVAVASTPLIYGWYFNLTPNHLSNLAFPLALYILVRGLVTGTWQWRIMSLFIVFLFPPFHPLPAFTLLVILLLIWLPERIKASFIRKTPKISADSFRYSILSLLLFVWVVTWISSFYSWNAAIRNIYTVITAGGLTHLVELMSGITYAEGYGYSVVQHFFKVYGGAAVYIILTLIAFPLLWRRTAIEKGLGKIIGFYGPLVVMAVTIIVLYFFHIGFGPPRLLIYVVILCTPFVGFILYEFLRWTASHTNWLAKIAPFLVTILLLVVSLQGISKMYPSSYTLNTSSQTTRTGIAGTTWFIYNKNTEMNTFGLAYSPGYFAVFLLPGEELRQRGDISEEAIAIPPWHFGYDEQPRLGASYNEDEYMILATWGRLLYVEIYPDMAELRYSQEDFVNLEKDPSVDRVYSNSGLDVYYVHAVD